MRHVLLVSPGCLLAVILFFLLCPTWSSAHSYLRCLYRHVHLRHQAHHAARTSPPTVKKVLYVHTHPTMTKAGVELVVILLSQCWIQPRAITLQLCAGHNTSFILHI
ncbi:hypothetical protein B0H13DRAFT_2040598 [Mycena leptocephala]|nr:hypothetical protein B0H13DRAFT_2040598 [Mycena leptocephala]